MATPNYGTVNREQESIVPGLIARPFLKWAGGKKLLLSQFEPVFPESICHYYEPFAGSAAVFFHLCATRPDFSATLSDINGELIRTYIVIRDEVDGLIEKLGRLRAKHEKKQYLKVRAQQPSKLSEVDAAARFIYLNKTCFNGLYRVNSRGLFNVPMGSYRQPRIFDEDNLRAVSAVLQDVTIRVAHFSECLQTPSGGFVYFDPPYVPLSSTSNFTSYTKEPFGEQQQQELAAVAQELDSKGVRFLLSNSDTELVRRLYAKFRVDTVYARRAINSRADARGAISEVIVRNY
jgi:DNA adenine methylase